MYNVGDILRINDIEYFIFSKKDDILYLMTVSQPLSIIIVKANDKIEIIDDKREIIRLLSELS